MLLDETEGILPREVSEFPELDVERVRSSGMPTDVLDVMVNVFCD